MEQARQMIGANGLQIPLLLMQRYGLQPGAQVVLELGPDGIRVVPALARRPEIESKALRYLFRNLGDAVTIEAQQHDSTWRVIVFTSSNPAPIGELVYALTGDFLEEHSTPPETMRRRAIEVMGEE